MKKKKKKKPVVWSPPQPNLSGFELFRGKYEVGPKLSRSDVALDAKVCSEATSAGILELIGQGDEEGWGVWCGASSLAFRHLMHAIFREDAAKAPPRWLQPEIRSLSEKYEAGGEISLKSREILNIVRPSCEPFLQALIECVGVAKDSHKGRSRFDRISGVGPASLAVYYNSPRLLQLALDLNLPVSANSSEWHPEDAPWIHEEARFADRTIAHFAAMDGKTELLELLESEVADLASRPDAFGITPRDLLPQNMLASDTPATAADTEQAKVQHDFGGWVGDELGVVEDGFYEDQCDIETVTGKELT